MKQVAGSGIINCTGKVAKVTINNYSLKVESGYYFREQLKAGVCCCLLVKLLYNRCKKMALSSVAHSVSVSTIFRNCFTAKQQKKKQSNLCMVTLNVF